MDRSSDNLRGQTIAPGAGILSSHERPLPIDRRASGWWVARAIILNRWALQRLPKGLSGIALKTDLYDEAAGPHHHAAFLPSRLRFLGMDRGEGVARRARRRLQQEGIAGDILVCDVRALPFADESLALELSLSTLDHFAEVDRIAASLEELLRVLQDGGRLFLTLDNPRNPEVALRSALPDILVQKLRRSRFPLGVTLGAGAIRRMLPQAGGHLLEHAYLIHAPRYPLLRWGQRIMDHRSRRRRERLIKWLLGWERFCKGPGGVFSGHYVGLVIEPLRGGAQLTSDGSTGEDGVADR